MSPDQFQQAWQSDTSQTRVTVNADLLLREVRRNEQDFRDTIFRRDLLEVGVGLLMLPVWLYLGVSLSLPWSWYLAMPAIAWVGGFIVVDRRRHQRTPLEAGAPLVDSVRESLRQVEHQIWLLKNIFWWYLLPLTVPMLAFFAQVAWRRSGNWWDAIYLLGTSASVLSVDYLVYCLNQNAVRKQLEPRRRELLALLADLGDDAAIKAGAIPPGSTAVKSSLFRRFLIVACLCCVIVEAVVLVGFVGRNLKPADYPKRAPYAAIRWQQAQPEVQLDGEWHRLISIDGTPVAEIVAFSQQTYGVLWQKRFEEDLVELLTRMKRPPSTQVTLVVEGLATRETRTLRNVSMTEANRQSIYQAARDRERGT